MKKGKYVEMVLAILFVFIFVNCALAKTVIRIAHHAPPEPEYTGHAAAMVFKAFIEGQSGGEIEVAILPAGQVGNIRSAAEQCQNNLIQMMPIDDGSATSFVPEMQLFSLPYLFSSRTIAWQVLDGPMGDELAENFLKRSGLKVLGWGENGYRHFTNNSRVIKSPADMKGMKIRVMESPSYIAMVKGLGANPTPIAWTELYSALQQKVVDGQENPITNIISGKLYEVQKFLTLDGHTYSIHAWVINNDVWKGLSEKNRRIVKDAARMAIVAHRAASTMNDVRGSEILTKAGVQIYAPSSSELEKFKSMAQPPVEEFLKEKIKGPWLEKLKKSIAEVKSAMEKVH